MAEVIIGLGALDRRLNAISPLKGGSALMKKLAASTIREEKLLVPRKTGNLGRSIHVQSVTAESATIIAAANYAAFVEYGTKPHEITPNAKKALRFAASAAGRRLSGSPRKGANVVFAKVVHHPGTKPHPYMVPGAKLAVSRAGLVEEIIKEWNGAA